MTKKYIRYSVHNLDEVIPYIADERVRRTEDKKKHRKYFGDNRVNLFSLRLRTFKKKGVVCPCCGIKASFFALESNLTTPNQKHLNLYGVDKYGNEVLFTHDHIIPKSKGGKDHISNTQTTCIECNQLKGNNIDPNFSIIRSKVKNVRKLKSVKNVEFS